MAASPIHGGMMSRCPASCAHLDATCPDNYADLLVPISSNTPPESETNCPSPAGAGARTMDRRAGARTNAGELVDAALHEGWQGIAADTWALERSERFGRSASL